MNAAQSPQFDRYIGVDYSGAETTESGIKGIQAYLATRHSAPVQVVPGAGTTKHWSRIRLAQWLLERLSEESRTLIGIDHGFSFPHRYFEAHELSQDWPAFLDDFQRHWPTDEPHVYVDFIREGVVGAGQLRTGNSRWRRIAETRCRAKSVFHFDVPGSVAKSTHCGLPWLRFLRQRAEYRTHFWPFDGWELAQNKSVIVEAYPSLWKGLFPREERTNDQHDAYTIAAFFRDSDRAGSLNDFFSPILSLEERKIARYEGWIFGVT